jgi:hypothetical protein
VHVGRNKLVSYSPLLLHQMFVLFVALVVQDLEVHKEVSVLEALYDDVVGF